MVVVVVVVVAVGERGLGVVAGRGGPQATVLGLSSSGIRSDRVGCMTGTPKEKSQQASSELLSE